MSTLARRLRAVLDRDDGTRETDIEIALEISEILGDAGHLELSTALARVADGSLPAAELAAAVGAVLEARRERLH